MFRRSSKRRRGRPSPDYGPRVCVWCASMLLYSVQTDLYYCRCGWRELREPERSGSAARD